MVNMNRFTIVDEGLQIAVVTSFEETRDVRVEIVSASATAAVRGQLALSESAAAAFCSFLFY